MITEITIPKIGYTMEEALVVKWLKNEGDPVKADEPVLEIASDKANIEIESPVDGILLKKLAQEDAYVPVLSAVGYVGEAGDVISDMPTESQSAQAAQPEAPSEPQAAEYGQALKNRLSPRARKFAREHNIDPDGLGFDTGTGYNGLIVERDLKALPERQPAEKADTGIGQTEYLTLSAYRQVTAKRLTQSVRDIPQFVISMDADAGALQSCQERLKKMMRVSITSILVKCVACAIQDNVNTVNVSWADGKIALHPQIRIGVAVATDNGLVVAVIDDPADKKVTAISAELEALAQKAREGRLTASEMSGSTFTISNLGMYGVDEFEAIINPPESGILAVGRIVKRPVVQDDDTITVRPVLRLNLTSDHRVLDGADAAKFLGAVRKYIECPEMMI